jgi:chromosome segregation ATPase
MNSANKVLAVVVVASLGLWGCAKGPAPLIATPERIKTLESRITKLEEDFRTAAAARDQLRHRLAAVEKERVKVQKERDDLQQRVSTRTTERDNVQAQFEQFRKGIRSLLGQAETAAAGAAAQPVSAVAVAGTAGKS